LKRSPVTIFLVGNKTDSLKREVTSVHIRTFIERQFGHIFYFETSALLNQGVLQLFTAMVTKIQEQRNEHEQEIVSGKSSFWN